MENKIIKKAFDVLKRGDVSANAKVLYSVLASGSQPTKDNPDVFINAYNQDQLKELTGIGSKATIIRATKELEQIGLIGAVKGLQKTSQAKTYVIY